MAWREDYYLYGKKDTLLLSVRYFQDSYIQASSFTTGCSSTHETETTCFPESSASDIHLNQICFFLKFAAIIVVFVDVIVQLIYVDSLCSHSLFLVSFSRILNQNPKVPFVLWFSFCRE